MFLRPTYLIDGDITDIDLDELEQSGIKGLIFDLDSTLVAPRSAVLTKEVEVWLTKARAGFKLAVVSNNRHALYIEQVKGLLDMPIVGRAAKPRRRGLLQALANLELAPHEVAVIGDRPLTDVWGGQRAGMKTILVFPLKTMNEPGWITFFRRLERMFIRS
jgi:HAD superfamily phosphatase (TIGR01668 family)